MTFHPPHRASDNSPDGYESYEDYGYSSEYSSWDYPEESHRGFYEHDRDPQEDEAGDVQKNPEAYSQSYSTYDGSYHYWGERSYISSSTSYGSSYYGDPSVGSVEGESESQWGEGNLYATHPGSSYSVSQPSRRVEKLSAIGIDSENRDAGGYQGAGYASYGFGSVPGSARRDYGSAQRYGTNRNYDSPEYVSEAYRTSAGRFQNKNQSSRSPGRKLAPQLIRVWYRPLLAMLAVIGFLTAYDLISGDTSHNAGISGSDSHMDAQDGSVETHSSHEEKEEKTVQDIASAGPEHASTPAVPTSEKNKEPEKQNQNLPIPPKAARVEDIGALPEGDPITESGTGTYRTIPGANHKHGEGRERVITYVIQVEEGINPAEYGGDQFFADTVTNTLADKRSWIGDSAIAFQQIDESTGEEPDLRIQLSSMVTTHEVCGQNIKLETSCYYRIGNRVVLNEARWVRGAAGFLQNVDVYRQYMINHEVGHGIGHAAHVPCAGQGDKAPIMMQQTISLNNQELYSVDSSEVYANQDISCRPNAWVYPDP